jgi:hypothetical protein
MDKIRKLEQQWTRYKAKKIVLLLLFLSIFYALSAGGYYAFLNWDSVNNFFSKKVVLHDLNASTPNEKGVVHEEDRAEDIIKKEVIEKEESAEVPAEELSLKPVIPIIDMEKERVTTPKPVVRKEKTHSNRVNAKPSTYLTAQELSKIKVSNREERDTTRLKKIHLGSSSKDYIETMKKKFLKSKNSRDALLLAKAFYREKNYKESEKWALEANKLDSHLDESWILFAQAKAKMGKKNEAIKVLAMYYKENRLPKIKAMIEKIKTGKL